MYCFQTSIFLLYFCLRFICTRPQVSKLTGPPSHPTAELLLPLIICLKIHSIICLKMWLCLSVTTLFLRNLKIFPNTYPIWIEWKCPPTWWGVTATGPEFYGPGHSVYIKCWKAMKWNGCFFLYISLLLISPGQESNSHASTSSWFWIVCLIWP